MSLHASAEIGSKRVRGLVQHLKCVFSNRDLRRPNHDFSGGWQVAEGVDGTGSLLGHDDDRLVLGEHRGSLDPSGVSQRAHVSHVRRRKHVDDRPLFQLGSDFLGCQRN